MDDFVRINRDQDDHKQKQSKFGIPFTTPRGPRIYKISKTTNSHAERYTIQNFTNNQVTKISRKVQNEFKFIDFNPYNHLFEEDFETEPEEEPTVFEMLSFICDGNVVEPHAFNPASDYINSLDLKCSLSTSRVLKVDEISGSIMATIENTDFLVAVCRQCFVDGNLLLMVLRSCLQRSGLGTEQPLLQFSLKTDSSYQLNCLEQSKTSQDNMLSDLVEHIESYCCCPDVKTDTTKLQKLFDSFDLFKKMDFLDSIIGKCNDKTKTKIKFWGSLIARRKDEPVSKDLYQNLLHIFRDLNQYLPEKIETSSTTIEQFRIVYFKWKQKLQKISATQKQVSDLEFKFPTLPEFEENLLESIEPFELDIEVNDQKFIVKATHFQAYLLSKIRDTISISQIDSFCCESIWKILTTVIPLVERTFWPNELFFSI